MDSSASSAPSAASGARSVCYLGAFDQEFSRNRIIRAGLEAHGWQVSLAPLPTGLNLRRTLPLLWRTMRTEAARCDALIVAEGNHLLAPLAVGLGRLLGKPVVLDYTTGLHETRVTDNNASKPKSWRARGYRALDAWNMTTAAGVFTDTAAHRTSYLAEIGRAARRMAVVPLGLDDAWLEAPPAPEKHPDEPLLIQFYGGFSPFHGLEVILRALSWLNTDERFRFELIGDGPMHQAAIERARLLGLQRLEFIAPPDTADLVRLVGRADLCLGVFARRDKTDFVVPQRLLECMALGKTVVTAESAGVSEYFSPGEDLLTVPPSNPGELARMLRRLADAPDLRERVALTGANTVRQRYTAAQSATPLVELLERVAGGGGNVPPDRA